VRRVGTWLVPAVLVALIAVVAVLSVQRWQDRTAARLEDAPASVGEAAARDFFTLDHRTIDEDIARVRASATGEFAAQYEEQAAELQQSVREKQLVLTATVPESGTALEYLGDDQAWVLVSVDVHTVGAGGVSDDGRYRTRVVLERVDDRWLVSRLEQVG